MLVRKNWFRKGCTFIARISNIIFTHVTWTVRRLKANNLLIKTVPVHGINRLQLRLLHSSVFSHICPRIIIAHFSVNQYDQIFNVSAECCSTILDFFYDKTIDILHLRFKESGSTLRQKKRKKRTCPKLRTCCRICNAVISMKPSGVWSTY